MLSSAVCSNTKLTKPSVMGQLSVVRKWSVAGLAVLMLVACKPQTESRTLTQFDGRTMGTYYTVKITDPMTEGQQKALQSEINDVLKRCNQEISTYDPHSELSRFNQSRDLTAMPVSAGLADLVRMALTIGHDSGGKHDVTVGPLVNLWGFGPDKRPVKIPTDAQIADARARIGLQHLKVSYAAGQAYLQKDLPDLYVDLSSMGEGMGAEAVADLLETKGLHDYLVEVAGSSRSRGLNDEGKPWRLAIQKPTDEENAVQAIIQPDGMAVSTSGTYRNYYELDGKRFSHIIDPSTGKPISHRLVSATVIMRSAREADGWATTMMVMGPDLAYQFAKAHGFAVYLISKTDKGFKAEYTQAFEPYLIPDSN